MIAFPWLLDAGAVTAVMSGLEDGDCGWDGCNTGERSAFLKRSGVPADRLVAVRQCHGDRIVTVEPDVAGRGADSEANALADADALITCHPGIPLGIHVADCVPVLLCAPGAIGIVHAGREGTARAIAGKTVEALVSCYHVDPSAIFAVIAPSAGPCCYEVDPALRDRCVERGMAAEGNHLDLWSSNARQLIRAGVPEANIQITRWCTICRPGFHSYRGQQSSRRNLAVLMR